MTFESSQSVSIKIKNKKLENINIHIGYFGTIGITRSGIGIPDTRKSQNKYTRPRPVSRFHRVTGTRYPAGIGSGSGLPVTRYPFRHP